MNEYLKHIKELQKVYELWIGYDLIGCYSINVAKKKLQSKCANLFTEKKTKRKQCFIVNKNTGEIILNGYYLIII